MYADVACIGHSSVLLRMKDGVGCVRLSAALTSSNANGNNKYGKETKVKRLTLDIIHLVTSIITIVIFILAIIGVWDFWKAFPYLMLFGWVSTGILIFKWFKKEK